MSDYEGLRDQDASLLYYAPPRAKTGLFNAVVFAVVAGLSLLAIVVLVLWSSRDAQLESKKIAIENLAQTIGHHTDAIIKQADVVLSGVVQSIAAEGMQTDHLRRMTRILAQQLNHLPQVQDFIVLDQSGQRVLSAHPLAPVMNTAMQGSYFAYHMTSPNPEPYIGPPQRKRSNNEWVFTVSRRINHQDGSFAGVVVARISISHFISLYGGLAVGHDRTMALVMNNGTVLWRLPFTEAHVGSNIINGPLFGTYLKSRDKGTETMKSAIDGVTRLVSFVRLDDYPLVVYVANSQTDMLGDWRRNSVIFTFIVLCLSVVLGWLGYRLLTLVKNQERAGSQLRETQERLLRANNALELLAREDSLTGLNNRREFEYTAQLEFKRALRDQHAIGLLMLDIDYFKRYNDTYGHQMGDECLRRVSAIIKAAVSRPGDLVARYGGEEFVVVLPNTSSIGSMKVAERIRKAVYDAAIPNETAPLGILTISIGLQIVVPDEDDSVKTMVAAADKALYQAKTGGRNRCVVA
ncbi:MAG: GGDEF domain-containing protein [Burkholderiaceae bacterium]|nr:GGDEF domain-containing protein [Burkholderiaceae bacterium]